MTASFLLHVVVALLIPPVWPPNKPDRPDWACRGNATEAIHGRPSGSGIATVNYRDCAAEYLQVRAWSASAPGKDRG